MKSSIKYALLFVACVYASIAVAQQTPPDPDAPDGQDIVEALRGQRTDMSDRFAVASAHVEKLKKQLAAERKANGELKTQLEKLKPAPAPAPVPSPSPTSTPATPTPAPAPAPTVGPEPSLVPTPN